MNSSKNKDENNKLIDHLNEILSIENAVIERLERRILETPIKDSKNLLQQHLQEEKEQQRRLFALISSYDKKPTDSKADIISLHSLINKAREKKKKERKVHICVRLILHTICFIFLHIWFLIVVFYQQMNAAPKSAQASNPNCLTLSLSSTEFF